MSRIIALSVLLATGAPALAGNPTLRPGTYAASSRMGHPELSAKRLDTGRADRRLQITGDKVRLGQGYGIFEGAEVTVKPVTRQIRDGRGGWKTLHLGWQGSGRRSDQRTGSQEVSVRISDHAYRGTHAGLRTVEVDASHEQPGMPSLKSQSSTTAWRISRQ